MSVALAEGCPVRRDGAPGSSRTPRPGHDLVMAKEAQRSPVHGILGSNVCVLLQAGVAIIMFLGFLGTAQMVGIEMATASPSTSSTVWLCRPGLSGNPCTSSLTTTVVRANGTTYVQYARPARNPAIDCFYVYPTVSTQPTANANLHIDPQERAVAIAQASPFSQVCRVYAPMYPQLTISAISKGIRPQSAVTAYFGVLSAWKNYLARDNNGRGVVLIGHSQGASLLIGLIKREVDPNPTERHLLVSALLMGGNVIVPTGQVVGGDFAHIPACQTNAQTGCVLAYSSFNSMPPANSFFGRVGTSISALSGLSPTSAAGLQVLCTNPTALAGGAGPSNPYFPTKPFPGSRSSLEYGATSMRTVRTPWVSYPNLYRAQCQSSGGATWLQVTDTAGPKDTRPTVEPVLGPKWGLHLDDVNLALGNLVQVVRDESLAYAHSVPRSPGR